MSACFVDGSTGTSNGAAHISSLPGGVFDKKTQVLTRKSFHTLLNAEIRAADSLPLTALANGHQADASLIAAQKAAHAIALARHPTNTGRIVVPVAFSDRLYQVLVNVARERTRNPAIQSLSYDGMGYGTT